MAVLWHSVMPVLFFLIPDIENRLIYGAWETAWETAWVCDVAYTNMYEGHRHPNR